VLTKIWIKQAWRSWKLKITVIKNTGLYQVYKCVTTGLDAVSPGSLFRGLDNTYPILKFKNICYLISTATTR